MRKLLTVLCLALAAFFAGMVGVQFLPGVAKAIARVQEYELARSVNDAAKVAGLTAQTQINELDAARMHALNSEKSVVAALPFAERGMVWSIRAAVLQQRLDVKSVTDMSYGPFFEAFMAANAKQASVAASLFMPLAALPVGSDKTWVWVGPPGYSPWLTVLPSIFNGMRVVVVPEAGDLKVDMTLMLQKSAAENAKYVAAPDGSVNPQMMKVLTGYTGDAEDLWTPLAAMSGQSG